MTTINGRIATVREIGRMVAKLGLSREERADAIEALTGERSLVKLNSLPAGVGPEASRGDGSCERGAAGGAA